jgi:UDP-2,3-diacylglucosamine pyrophosphatase LpxH
MGVRFSLEHANYVSYLISHDPVVVPRANRRHPSDFLLGLTGFYHTSDVGFTAFDDRAVRIGGPYQLISSDPAWMLPIAAEHQLVLLRGFQGADILPSQIVKSFLDPLRDFFRGFSLCALVIPERPASEHTLAREFFEYAAISSGPHGIFLMPERVRDVVNILDPFPQLRALAENPVKPPAVTFWCPIGREARAFRLAEGKEFYDYVLRPILGGDPVEIDRAINNARESPAGRIIHLSDFHFGERQSNRTRQYVKAHLKNLVKRDDRVVVTGDQMNTPNGRFYDEYIDFRSDIQELTEQPLLDIPGNHDIRRMGNKLPWVGKNTYEWVTDRNPVVVDDSFGCVFFCFNSIEEGDFARGYVSDDQLLRMSTAYEREITKQAANGNRDFPNYLKIALVHHHPFTYVTKPSAFYDKLIRLIFRSEDKFVRFDNADRFVNWCAERGVSLILHGHKHVPHHIRTTIPAGRKGHEITVVSCGSTMGAEKSPLCYDIISWDKATRAWNVAFYQDRSSSGFKPQEVDIDLR